MADPLALARQLLDEACAGRPGATALGELASLDPDELAAALVDDVSRIAFWLNVYNAVVRARILADPAAFRRRWRFFGRPAVVIAGQRLSPNTIENGILRRSAFILGLGYLHNPIPSKFERHMRVSRVDPRIHFALNCGARSCPPLAAWDSTTLDRDLERATAAYLTSETCRIENGRGVRVPRLLLWYRGDFGGIDGVRRLLRRHAVVGADERPRLRFGPYDWTIDVPFTAHDGANAARALSDRPVQLRHARARGRSPRIPLEPGRPSADGRRNGRSPAQPDLPPLSRPVKSFANKERAEAPPHSGPGGDPSAIAVPPS